MYLMDNYKGNKKHIWFNKNKNVRDRGLPEKIYTMQITYTSNITNTRDEKENYLLQSNLLNNNDDGTKNYNK